MINSLFRSLLMQGAGEEPVPCRWEYADYIHPKTTAPNGIELKSYKLSNTSNNLTIDFKIPTSITQNDSIYIVHQGSFLIKAYYSSSKLTLWVQCSDLTTFTVSQYGTDDGTQIHRVTLKNGYVWLDKQLDNNTQAVKTSLNGRPKIAENFTSDCAIYNIYYYLNTETHSQILFSKTNGFECPYSYLGSAEMNTINTIQVAETWVGNFDYEPNYVDYIEPQTSDGFKLLNLSITAYPKTKLSCEVSQEYTSTIYTAGYWIDYDDYYERGFNQLQGGLGSAVVYQQSPTKYTFSSVATGTKFTFDNFSGTPKMNGATGVSSNIGYDRTWTEDDEGVIKTVHTIWAGTKVYSFKISANGINTYDCLPVIPHYNVAWAALPGSSSYIDGYLMDKNTGFRFMPVADVSNPSMQLVSFFKNPVDDPSIPFYIENVSDTTNNIYISINESNIASFSIFYSTNNVNWNIAAWNNSSSSTTISFSKYYKIITLPVGGRVYFKSFNSAAYLTSHNYSSARYTPSFASTGNIVAGGNLSSLNNNNFTDSTTYVAASSTYIFEPNTTGGNYLQDVKKMYICINAATNLNYLFYNCNQIDTVFISKHLNSGWGTTNNFITNNKSGTIYFPTGMTIPTGNNGISSTWTKKNL